MAPRLLLTPEQQALWLGPAKDGELNPELVETEAWQQQVNNPRIMIYQTGRLDATLLGGPTEYGKLHGKFIVEDHFGFIGTSNFDYRSRLFNNEMGYFVDGPGVLESLHVDFEMLRALSYRWGSPQWLEMRRRAMEAKGVKSWSVRNQRTVFRTLKAMGLDWFF